MQSELNRSIGLVTGVIAGLETMGKDANIPGVISALKEVNELLQTAYSSPRLQEAAEWVRVSERLPEVEKGHAKEVTICSHIFDAKEPMVVASGVFYNGDFYLCAEWHGWDLDTIEPLTPGRVTHWRPLPAPPKPNNEIK